MNNIFIVKPANFKYKTIFICLLLLLILFPQQLFAVQDSSNDSIILFSGKIQAEILPRMELLVGVLSHTSYSTIVKAQDKQTDYYQELHRFLQPFSRHPAVKSAEELLKKWGRLEAPYHFVLTLGELPALKMNAVYNNLYCVYLPQRAGGMERLEKFRRELADLAEKSNFMSFFAQHRGKLCDLLQNSLANSRLEEIAGWLQEFFEEPDGEFRILFSPASLREGGFSCAIQKPGGEYLYYQIVRAGAVQGRTYLPKTTELDSLSLHEWSHPFVHRSLDETQKEFNELKMEEFYTPVKEMMQQQYYGSPQAFFEELIVRAVQGIGIKEFFDMNTYQAYLEGQRLRGFYLIDAAIQELEYYIQHKDEFDCFSSFVRYFFQQLHRNRERLIKEETEYYRQTTQPLTEAYIQNLYWSGDPRIGGRSPNKKNAFLLAVSFPIENPRPQQISDFLVKAGREFNLIAKGKPVIGVKIFLLEYLSTSTGPMWGFWLEFEEGGFERMEPGVSYRLEPKRAKDECSWIIPEDLTLVLNEDYLSDELSGTR